MDKVRSKEEVVDRTLFEAGQPDPSQQIRFSWMNERLHVLCWAGLGWALGQVPSLAGPTEPRSGEFVAGS